MLRPAELGTGVNYAKPAGVLGAAAGVNGVLAFTGFYSLLWAEFAVVLTVVGLVMVRMGRMRRLRPRDRGPGR